MAALLTTPTVAAPAATTPTPLVVGGVGLLLGLGCILLPVEAPPLSDAWLRLPASVSDIEDNWLDRGSDVTEEAVVTTKPLPLATPTDPISGVEDSVIRVGAVARLEPD